MNPDYWIKILIIIGLILLLVSFGLNFAKAASDPLIDLYGQVVSKNAAEARIRLLEGNPRAYLYWKGTKEGLAQGEISRLDTILFCESRWIATAQNNSSSAAGLGQVIRATWLAYSDYPWSERYNPHRNIQTVIKIYQARGTQPWAQCL